MLELLALGDEDLAEIIRRRLENRAVAPSTDEIRDTLTRIDGAGRPLYAYLLAEHLAEGDEAPRTQEDLLGKALKREQSRFWGHKATRPLPDVVADDPAMRLAVLATLARGVEAGAALATLDVVQEREHD